MLIALVDPAHVAHEAAHRWFSAFGAASWATCPISENGMIRILGHPKYPNSAGSPAAVVPMLSGMRTLPGHVFWPDDISLFGSELVDPTHLTTAAQVTDAYLLALAERNGVPLLPVRETGGLVTADIVNALRDESALMAD